jgi:hypothetical protein
VHLSRKNFSKKSSKFKLTGMWFLLTIIAIGVVTAFSPAEYSLGAHIRIVYLHGAWVWAALAGFVSAGAFGGLGLLSGRNSLHAWSAAFGRAGLVFWITYLPLSLIAMQANWNGLFLAEPRWRLALVFSITGILLQAGLSLAGIPRLTSGLNLGYLITLMIALGRTPNVMHPASPILSSDAWRIQFYFFGLVLLTFLAVWQMARWWYQGEPGRIQR